MGTPIDVHSFYNQGKHGRGEEKSVKRRASTGDESPTGSVMQFCPPVRAAQKKNPPAWLCFSFKKRVKWTAVGCSQVSYRETNTSILLVNKSSVRHRRACSQAGTRAAVVIKRSAVWACSSVCVWMHYCLIQFTRLSCAVRNCIKKLQCTLV